MEGNVGKISAIVGQAGEDGLSHRCTQIFADQQEVEEWRAITLALFELA